MGVEYGVGGITETGVVDGGVTGIVVGPGLIDGGIPCVGDGGVTGTGDGRTKVLEMVA